MGCLSLHTQNTRGWMLPWSARRWPFGSTTCPEACCCARDMIGGGTESVDLVFRHDTPRFVSSDWSFTDAMIENTLRVRGWFQHLDANEQEAIQKRFWSVGRLQL